ncbi:MAG: slipin family protein [Candidatus Pacebacteria bacterium]|jgi:regulator of protease activity HflC (stomatin/prohibitin superfamily)|nr:slipin family protein [Candidatus Paceibacterota bacterium]MBT4652734.1 slipin family protein [Candidatus Paceibacterota bacterium]MBT6755891.1 slipin family protein [Candidatus Paceibacterota bacterium]MBT6921104.1 slipin family protein [Candidatus Paceibacterota bacterium]
MYFIPWIVVLILVSLKQINQYQRGVIYTMGRFSGVVNPGWRFVLPIFQSFRKVDIRVKATDVPKQETITKDNISCKMNAVIYYKISDPNKAVNEVENVFWAVSQLAQTTMRRIAGEATLDELLSQREKIAKDILESIDPVTDKWGIDVEAVELKDIELPENMIRTMAKQAEAEREKRAAIINSEGEVAAAKNLQEAAKMMGSTPGALHLRTLNSINDLSSDQSNTVIFALPVEILRAFESFSKMKK